MPTITPIVAAGAHRSGRAGGYLLAWLIGVPVPILLIIFLLRGCS
jgi:hypothetical protein